MGNSYKYLLLRYKSSSIVFTSFTHTNPPPCSAIFIKNPFLSQIVRGNKYIAIENNNKDGKYLYFSFSFENINNTKINEYNIYHIYLLFIHFPCRRAM